MALLITAYASGSTIAGAFQKGTYLPVCGPISLKIDIINLKNLKEINTPWVKRIRVLSFTLYGLVWFTNSFSLALYRRERGKRATDLLLPCQVSTSAPSKIMSSNQNQDLRSQNIPDFATPFNKIFNQDSPILTRLPLISSFLPHPFKVHPDLPWTFLKWSLFCQRSLCTQKLGTLLGRIMPC